MIASTPVARWLWGRDSEVDVIIRCIRDSLCAYSVLSAHQLACGNPNFKISVTKSGKSNSYLFRGEIPSGGGAVIEVSERLARAVEADLDPGEIGSVDTSVRCSGILMGKEGGYLQDDLFHLGTSAFLDFVTTDLITYSDAWMAYDLKGIPQPVVCAKNAPRLTSALKETSVILDSETDPEDPTRFGKPTENGVESHFEDDGTPSDSWGRFEIPYRNGIFRETSNFDPGYRRTASGSVLYFAALGRSGVLGYLWASDTEGAASFEPRDEADLDCFRAGIIWLKRLNEACERRLTPIAALIELRSMQQPSEAGVLMGKTPLEVSGVWQLGRLPLL
ncbi:hypothetical protein ACFVWY_30270 [Streptomyces sp. NPDC058195]|uniref:hypothetical protein n=1 Tax=Streptomyces sp. NPDC058195 TaxID=3346375 RepID=UPI0036F0DC55